MNELTRPLPLPQPDMTPRERALLARLGTAYPDTALPDDVRLMLWATMQELSAGFHARGRLYLLRADADARVAVLRAALLAKLATRAGMPLAQLLSRGDRTPDGQLVAIDDALERLHGDPRQPDRDEPGPRPPREAHALASWEAACDALAESRDTVTTNTMAVRFSTDAWIQLGWPLGRHAAWRPQITLGRRAVQWQSPTSETRELSLEAWSVMGACIAGLSLVEALCDGEERRERLAGPLRWALAQLAAERISPSQAIAAVLGLQDDGSCADPRLEAIRIAWERGGRRGTFVVVVAAIDRRLGFGGEAFGERPAPGTWVEVRRGADPLPGGAAGSVLAPPPVSTRRFRRAQPAAPQLAHVRIGGRAVVVPLSRLRTPRRVPLL